ncbi:MAG: phosphatidylglycerophosphatase A [Synergistaceae bacterium]|jgi:phosphatidylglycerophosphatase A|nr:phosphatidylglycerophosphatase A [Synergistaceae bacterium]
MNWPKRGTPAFYTWYGIVSTLCGLGCLGGFAGAAATLISCLSLFVIGSIGGAALCVTAVVGAVASDRYVKRVDASDRPQEIVIDRVAGYWASMLWLDSSYAIVAFLLFRIVDVLKPFPASIAGRMPGGVGIMAGGILGGSMVNVMMRIISWMFFSGGIDLIYRYLGVGE